MLLLLTGKEYATFSIIIILFYFYYFVGARGSIVVKALCYKPEGRGFETR
jgi:hypothetical protein